MPQLVYILIMKLIKADNYQTWYIENENESIIIDPWLTPKLNEKNSFFIQRTKKITTHLETFQINKIKAIIITAPFEDHLNIESIKYFSNQIPIYTSNIVLKLLLKKGVSNPINILNEVGANICKLKVSALPTSYPYYSSTFSILFEDSNNNRIFHEGHIVNFKYLKAKKIKADIAILTAEQVRLFGLITLGMGTKNTLEACKILESNTLFITGNNPKDTKGFISKFLLTKKMDLIKLSKKLEVYFNGGDSIEIS